MPFGSPAALCCGFPDSARYIFFLLQPVESGVKRPNRDRPTGSLLNILPYTDAIGILAKPCEGGEDEDFKFTKVFGLQHDRDISFAL